MYSGKWEFKKYTKDGSNQWVGDTKVMTFKEALKANEDMINYEWEPREDVNFRVTFTSDGVSTLAIVSREQVVEHWYPELQKFFQNFKVETFDVSIGDYENGAHISHYPENVMLKTRWLEQFKAASMPLSKLKRLILLHIKASGPVGIDSIIAWLKNQLSDGINHLKVNKAIGELEASGDIETYDKDHPELGWW
jgi:hypothetical protein